MRDEPNGIDVGRDPEVAEALSLLDPARRDPGYWFGFREAVLSRAAAELARRRTMAETSVSDVVARWSRTLVPTALATAAAALLIMFQVGEPEADSTAVAPVALEELFADDFTVELSEAIETPEESVEVLLASTVF